MFQTRWDSLPGFFCIFGVTDSSLPGREGLSGDTRFSGAWSLGLGGAGHGLHHEGREQTEARSQAESQLSMLAQSTVGVPVRLRIWGSDSGLRSGISCWKEQ